MKRMMTALWAVIISVTLLCGAALASTQKGDPAPAQGRALPKATPVPSKTYTDAQYGISLNVPQGWARPLDGAPGTFVFEDNTLKTFTISGMGMTLGEYRLLQSPVDENFESSITSGPGRALVSRQIVTDENDPSALFVVNVYEGGHPLTLLLSIRRGLEKQMIVISVTWPQNDLDALYDTYMTFVEPMLTPAQKKTWDAQKIHTL